MPTIYIIVTKYKGKKGWIAHPFRKYYWDQQKAKEAAMRYKKQINWDAPDNAVIGVQSLSAEGGGVLVV